MTRKQVNDYRDALSDRGPLASTWADKPHRLVYDLCAEIDVLEARMAAMEKDRERLDWLQQKYGEHPWKLVGMVPGTNDVRVAIDRAMVWVAPE